MSDASQQTYCTCEIVKNNKSGVYTGWEVVVIEVVIIEVGVVQINPRSSPGPLSPDGPLAG